ncbi:MAG: polyprenyl synthetase family protein [Rhodothermales bacterium]|nr:polyprenyl synthetase family protein [Rhodothermales bacterium]
MTKLTGSLPEVISSLRVDVNEHLASLVTEVEPSALYDPVRYVLAGGGKRLRPIILLLTADGFGVTEKEALPAALAVEVFHNFTLVHDDIMDHSVERRGRPTVHTRWNQDVAILAGDYLLSLAYTQLSRSHPEILQPMTAVFGEMVKDLCEGQTLDKEFETRRDISVDDYLRMIDAKTGALLRACLELGGVLGRATADERRLLRQAGISVGRAFQIRDDLLDVIAEDDRWGKKVGGDLVEGKRTYLLLRCLELPEGDDRSWFERIVENDGLEEHLIPEARTRMIEAGVIEDAGKQIEHYTRMAEQQLNALSARRSLNTLSALLSGMMDRVH